MNLVIVSYERFNCFKKKKCKEINKMSMTEEKVGEPKYYIEGLSENEIIM